MNRGCECVNFSLVGFVGGRGGPGLHALAGLIQSQLGEFDPWFGRPGALLNSRIRWL